MPRVLWATVDEPGFPGPSRREVRQREDFSSLRCLTFFDVTNRPESKTILCALFPRHRPVQADSFQSADVGCFTGCTALA